MRRTLLTLSGVLLAALAVVALGSGCCGAPIAARREAAAELRDAAVSLEEAREMLTGARVPHPAYSEVERAKVRAAEMAEGDAIANVIKLAHELAVAEGN